MQMGKWTGSAEGFLNKFQKELSGKKVAIFVSSAAQALIEYENKTEEIDKSRKDYLENIAAKYSIQPVSMVIFGGVWDSNKMFFCQKNPAVLSPGLRQLALKKFNPTI